MLKRILPLLLAVLLLTGCAASGTGETTEAAQTQSSTAVSETQTVPTETEEATRPTEAPAEFIPQLYFEGDISGMQDKSDIRKIQVKYLDEDRELDVWATLKVQGTSSLYYEKKNYTITFYEGENFGDKQKIDFGWGPQNKYCLKANWIDKTHSRNIVSARLAAEIQARYGVLSEAPRGGLIDGYPVEIYANGDFLGLYTLNIPKDAWMFGMDADNPDHLVICGENWKDTNYFDGEPDFDTWAVEVGQESQENLDRMNRLFEFVADSSNDEFRAEFGQYLDLDATLHYIILCELGLMNDNLGKNMLLATYDGQLWYPSLYDLDTTWGTHWTGLCLENSASMPVLHEGRRSRLFTRVENVFGEELGERYFELREDILTEEHIMDQFYHFRSQVPTATWEKEQDRWQNIPGFDLDQIEEFLGVRIPLMDHYMEQLLQTAAARRAAEEI